MEVAKLVEETLDSLVSKIESLYAKLTQVEQERDELLEWKKGAEDRLCEAAVSLAGMVRLEQDRDRLAAEVERLKGKVDYITAADLRMHKRHDDLYEQHEILKGELATKCADCSHKNAFDLLTAAQQSAQEQFRAGMERAFPIILTAIKSYRSNIVCDEEGDGLELSDILATGYKDADIRRALEELDGLHDHICACLLAELSKGEGK